LRLNWYWAAFWLPAQSENGHRDGAWTGVRDENGFSYFHYLGAGRDGYEGLKLRMCGERLDPDASVPETYYGYILEQGG
jgi:hypothetical protein